MRLPHEEAQSEFNREKTDTNKVTEYAYRQEKEDKLVGIKEHE